MFEIFLCPILVLRGIPRRSGLSGGVPGYSGVFRSVPGLFLVIQTYTDTRNGCPLDAGRYKVGSIAFSIALRSVTIHFLHMSMIASPRMSETEGKVSLITLYTHWRADSFSDSNILQ